MTDDRMDDPMDDRIRDLARDYNAPGDVPREAMWEAIVARREQSRLVRGEVPSRRLRGWGVAGLAAAAAALLVVGIGIGRRMERTRSAGVPSATGAPIATVRPPVDTARREMAAAPESATAPESPAAPTRDRTEIPAGRPRRELAVVATARAGRLTGDERRAPDARALATRMLVLEHFAGTEAMLTSFRSEARNGAVDAQVTKWARDLLATTRTLRTMPGASDPTLQRLLDDLELVLVQIAQYTARSPHHAEELDLINEAIERHGVMGRLRTLPTGPIAGT